MVAERTRQTVASAPTPGPWRAEETSPCWVVSDGARDRLGLPKVVAQAVSDDAIDEDEAEANAAAIAALPDLLEGARLAEACLAELDLDHIPADELDPDITCGHCDVARALAKLRWAIARAEGRES